MTTEQKNEEKKTHPKHTTKLELHAEFYAGRKCLYTGKLIYVLNKNCATHTACGCEIEIYTHQGPTEATQNVCTYDLLNIVDWFLCSGKDNLYIECVLCVYVLCLLRMNRLGNHFCWFWAAAVAVVAVWLESNGFRFSFFSHSLPSSLAQTRLLKFVECDCVDCALPAEKNIIKLSVSERLSPSCESHTSLHNLFCLVFIFDCYFASLFMHWSLHQLNPDALAKKHSAPSVYRDFFSSIELCAVDVRYVFFCNAGFFCECLMNVSTS